MGMLKIFTAQIIFMLLSAGQVSAWESYVARSMSVYVQEVQSGNLLVVNERNESNENNLAISFYGIGIPTLKQPLGKEAHAELLELLPKGTKIIISTVREDDDGVISALVQLNDHSINNRLVDEGLAWVDRSTCKAFFCRRWHIQEHLAIKDRRGIWALNMSTPPWQWGE